MNNVISFVITDVYIFFAKVNITKSYGNDPVENVVMVSPDINHLGVVFPDHFKYYPEKTGMNFLPFP